MWLRDLVPRNGVVLSPTMTLREALGALRTGDACAAPVLSRSTPIGATSAADIEAWLAHNCLPGADRSQDLLDRRLVEEVMVRRVVALPADAVLEAAASTMRGLGVDRVLVMEADTCLGVVSVTEIARCANAAEPLGLV